MSDPMDDDPTDARLWAAIHNSAGGPAEFVRQFQALVNEGRFDEARKQLDPQFDWGDLTDLNLDILDRPGWALAGRPRQSAEGYEIVLFAYFEGALDELIIDEPIKVPAFEFLVRDTDDGSWLIFQITQPADHD